MRFVLAPSLALAVLCATARAATLQCSPDEAGVVTLDGLLDDWHEVKGAEAGDEDNRLTLRCNVEGPTLHLAIEARDERIVRTKQARPGEDHVSLSVGNKHFTLFPASETQKGKLVPGGAKMATASGPKSFAIELAVPLASLGQGQRPERLSFALRFDDCDSAVALTAEHTVTIEGELAFTAGDSVLDGFLSDRHLSRSTVRFQHGIRVGKDTAQVVLAGKYLATIANDGFGYVELPASDGKDVQKPQLVDLAGDGRPTILVRYTERGEGGSREVLAAYRATPSGMTRFFAVEIGKQVGNGRLATKLTLKKRGKATDVIVDALPATALTSEQYKEAPASDMEPILLPWTGPKRVTYTFSGDAYQKR